MRPWRPIVAGELRTHALGAVQRIATELARRPAEPRGDLVEGTAAFALLFEYVARTDLDVPDARTHAASQLECALDAIAEQPMECSLFGGFTGVAWAARHLRGDDDTDYGEIDSALLAAASDLSRPYDLVVGAAGIGIYALERGHEELLARVVEYFARTACETDSGVTWLTQPAWMTPRQLERAPNGQFNLGAAHGVPAVIAFLAQAAARGVTDADRLCRGALRWLLARDQPSDTELAFGFHYLPDQPREPGRLPWCCGDAGVAICLSVAAAALRDDAILGHAARIGRRAALCSASAHDLSLCHGTTGLALIFQRLHHATDDPVFAAAARRWVRATLDRLDALQPARLGLLLGATGTALGLLGASTSIEPAWDRTLAASVC